MSDFNPISLIFSAAGHAREAWAKRQEHGGSFKAAAKREAELIGPGQLKSSLSHVGARMLKDSMSMAARRGDYAMMTLYSIGHAVVQRHAERYAHEQKTFELTKRVERGEHAHLTDHQLAHVVEHAEQFGGPNAATIKARAEAQQVERARAKNAGKVGLAEEKRKAAQAHNEESRKLAETRRTAEKAEKEARRAERDAQKTSDRAKANEARQLKEKAQREAKEAAAKERAHANSPEAARQRAVAKMQGKIAAMSDPAYLELKRKEAQLKQSVKAAKKEQANNQQQFKGPGAGRPRVSEQHHAPGGKAGMKQGGKGQQVQQHGGKGKQAGKAANWQENYDAQGKNKLTGKQARGETLAALQDAGKVKAKTGKGRRPSVKDAARRGRGRR
jgi:hypothetical protein